jgi:hypothetical protein
LLSARGFCDQPVSTANPASDKVDKNNPKMVKLIYQVRP